MRSTATVATLGAVGSISTVCVGQCGWFGTSEYNCTFELTLTRPASLVIR